MLLLRIRTLAGGGGGAAAAVAAVFPEGLELRQLYRTYGLLSGIDYRNRGNWCDPRVVPALREEIFRKMPKTLL